MARFNIENYRASGSRCTENNYQLHKSAEPESKVFPLFVVWLSAIDVKHVCAGRAAETGDLVKAGIRLLHPDLSFTLSLSLFVYLIKAVEASALAFLRQCY